MPQLRTASRPALASNSAGGFFIRRRVASPGALVAKGAVKPLAQRVRTHFSNKENVPPAGAARAKPKRRSPLPDWYPRTPLRDITSIVKALEKRNRLEEDAARQHIQWNEDSPQPVDPTTPVHAEHSDPDSQSTQTQETLGVVASGPGSTSAVANRVTSVAEDRQGASCSPSDCSLQMAPSKPNDPSPADLERKLSSSIEQIEKMVRRHMKETPKAAQPSKVVAQRRVLMSMR
ncbi:protein POLYCHOME-like [Miscanthus floridulus]|uniref:protein POLYCHOME-like n=1 Tax=Miscanthus floridulus TaxID=154761 RepID=UPI0034596E51